MVLCHGNSGKILSDRMSALRMEYKDNPEGFSESEKSFLDSTTVRYAGMAFDDNWTIETIPVEWLECKGPVLMDIRKTDPLKDDGRD